MARESAGLLSPLDRITDDLMLGILVLAAEDTKHCVGLARLDRLCQLRTVCSRFDKIIPGAERIVCTEVDSEFEGYETEILRFLQHRRAVRSLQLEVKVSQLFFEALSGAAPYLESFEISGAFQDSDHGLSSEERGLQFFKAMSMCDHLSALKVACGFTEVDFCLPLASRYPLRALKTLDISETSLEDPFVASIAQNCPCLETLRLVEVTGLQRTVICSSTLQIFTIKEFGSVHTSVLEVEAPRLSSLKASFIDKLSIDAPNLEELVLDGAKEIVKKNPWKVTTLIFGKGLERVEQLLEVFSMCPDAKVVLIQNPAASADSVYREGVALSSLLQSFKHLEFLELPCSLPEFLLREQQNCIDPKPLATLKHLKVGFRKAVAQYDLCLELAKVAPKLERITIDLQHMIRGPGKVAIDAIVTRSIRLQKLYPHLSLEVEWPDLRIV